jgi:RNA polymerase sigma factor (sigma-70 family)
MGSVGISTTASAVGFPQTKVLRNNPPGFRYIRRMLFCLGSGPANAFGSTMNGGLNTMSEEFLVSAAKAGDAVAFVELSAGHSRKILRRVYRIVKNWQDAEDVLQESLMKAFLHVKDFEEKSSFSSWLTRIAINSALMSLRKKRRYVETSIDAIGTERDFEYHWEPKDPAEDPEARLSRREREQLLQGAIQELPPKLRQIVQLKVIEGRSGQEVSRALGISAAAAKSRMARARTVLRISLASGDR